MRFYKKTKNKLTGSNLAISLFFPKEYVGT